MAVLQEETLGSSRCEAGGGGWRSGTPAPDAAGACLIAPVIEGWHHKLDKLKE